MVLPPLLVIACSIVYAPHALTFVTCSNCEVKANTTEGEEAATRNAKSHQVAQDVAHG
jgi:hypothetical protein